MSPKRRYQSSSLAFGIGINAPNSNSSIATPLLGGAEPHLSSAYHQPITSAEIAVNPCLTFRKVPVPFIPPKSSPELPRTFRPEEEYQPPQHQQQQVQRSSFFNANVGSGATPIKGNKTYRVRRHHQNYYEPPVEPSSSHAYQFDKNNTNNFSLAGIANSLSQGVHGLPVHQDYQRTYHTPTPSHNNNKDRDWDYEDLGDTKLFDPSSQPIMHQFQQQKDTHQQQQHPKPRMKSTLPSAAAGAPTATSSTAAPPRPGTPPYSYNNSLLDQDEMGGILHVRPASRSSRTRPEQHSQGHTSSTGHKKGRRRVQSTSAAVGNQNQHQQHHYGSHHQYHSGGRVSTAVSSSQEHIGDPSDPPAMEPLLQDCLIKLKSPDWEEICTAFSKIQVATVEAPSQVAYYLKKIIWAGIPHCSSSRTKVSRAACRCFKSLYETQRRSMEGEGEKVFQKLLDLCGGPSNKFIQDECKEALLAAVQNTDSYKSILLIEHYGAKHRNANVREFAALLLGKIMNRLHMDMIMNKIYGPKVIPLIVSFLKEGQLNTRLNAKNCLSKIVDHPDFNSALHRYVSPENIRHVNDTLKKFKGRRYPS